MKTLFFLSLGSIALASTFSALVVADPMLLVNHNAKLGPKQEALIACVQAARKSPALNQGQMFTSRIVVAPGPAPGKEIYVLHGSAWDNGERVPIVARCVTSNYGGAVARVARVNPDTRIADRRAIVQREKAEPPRRSRGR